MAVRINPQALRAHQVAVALAVHSVRIARRLRGIGAPSIGNQLIRSALSVPSNIAEACGRGRLREFRAFLRYAQGSAQEMLTQLRVVRRSGLASESALLAMESRAVTLLKMLASLEQHPPPSITRGD